MKWLTSAIDRMVCQYCQGLGVGRGPKDHINRSHILGPRPRKTGVPEIKLCRILMFTWSLGSRVAGASLWRMA